MLYSSYAESALLPMQVVHLERGLFGWYQSDLPMTGNYKPELGRTPMAAAEPTFKNINQSIGYEMKEGDKVVQEAKKGWFGF